MPVGSAFKRSGRRDRFAQHHYSVCFRQRHSSDSPGLFDPVRVHDDKFFGREFAVHSLADETFHINVHQRPYESAPGYQLSAIIDIHVTQQQTFIATGGAGIGVIQGLETGGAEEAFSPGPLPPTLLIVTSFGRSDCCGPPDFNIPTPYAYEFVFGQPFTLQVTADYIINAVSPSSLNAGGELFYSTLLTGIVDSGGRPVSATFTAVAEPSTIALLAAALLAAAIAVACSRGRAPRSLT